ncbi:biotin--[acetyl-CoA-carboxylase] ligase [Erythrobacter crassostreae]|uniref:biotin--[biotin carboxyl-carrier protein] ligase n=1 Tax=Erythrobacter crassostreae TaxID=2828328 RepID=A0A9X1F5G1_9SPHN|nr:biotin--[acetyl-CoA-carboxylase] ligase [Erythrobacter crassostrea]MBV7260224.1 biotin--[acetyl-CoA-carboxylase] ligase [Erythrobacter crassostrea]
MIETIEVTGSTNADLIDRIGNGEAVLEGKWLQAERQTGGRGRLGRKWESPSGNLFCSTVIDVREGDPPAHSLSFVVGLAVSDALKRSLLPRTPTVLKWPNDVLVRGAKIAGILLERVGDKVVAGVGVNVCHAPELPDRETTSVLYENGKHGGNPGLVLSLLADALVQRVSNWRQFGLPATLDAWTGAAHPVGTALSIKSGDEGEVRGSFAGLDQNGALLLCLANGALRTIHAGDVAMIAEG